MSKDSRAQYHARFADWLGDRAGDDLIEIRAYHLDEAVDLLTELDGAPPAELAETTATTLVKAAKRALAREAFPNGAQARAPGARAPADSGCAIRRRACGLEAAGLGCSHRSRWRRFAIRRESSRSWRIEALALTALGEAALKRDADTGTAKILVDDALDLLEGLDQPVAHFDALVVRATISAWLSDISSMVGYMEKAYAIAIDADRKDLQTIAAQALAQTHIVRFELDEAETLLTRALELAGESGSMPGPRRCRARVCMASSS